MKYILFFILCFLSLSTFGSVEFYGANQLFAIPNGAGWCVWENVTMDKPHTFALHSIRDDIGMCDIHDKACGNYLRVDDYVNDNHVGQSFAVPVSTTKFNGLLVINNFIDPSVFYDGVVFKECYTPILKNPDQNRYVWIWLSDGGTIK